ncbi:MAG: trypsin-like peptidase domain-containing protein [Defluviitaleaceae bacterium]|nr:trypsin-like peptidase domain-containing protein [Defluviitaleaceae bacterium]
MNEYRDVNDIIKNTDRVELREGMEIYDADIFIPKKRTGGVFRKLAVSMMAVAVGALFLGLGLSAGLVVMRNFTEIPPVVEEVGEAPAFQSVAYEPMVITIDPQTPDFTDVIARVKDSVVSINVTAQRHGGLMPGEHFGAGSGFFFAQDDDYVFVATNYHVVENTTSITISIDDNEEVPAYVIGREPDYDLAVLAVSKEDLLLKGVPFVIAELGCSDTMRMGDSVVAIGNAMGAGQTVTKGIISAVNLEITVYNQNTNTSLALNVLQTDAAVNQGNSGGPLINQHGEVIGIVTAKLFGHGIEGMGYVLPTNDIRDILAELKAFGTERHPWLGIQSEEITESVRDMFNLPSTGMLIFNVIEDSPAYHAGVRERDLLVRFSGYDIGSRLDLFYAMQDYKPGDEVIIGVYRGGEYMEIMLVLGSVNLVR